jgi:crotonobetainyl-CoA:carnitine CoA-transferase CaiB-like acyl-CoA transferase
LTESTICDAALYDVRILDLAAGLSGAFCTAQLERMGAEVRRLSVRGDGVEPSFLDAYLSASEVYRLHLGREQDPKVIDLGEPADVETLREAVAWADVVVEDGREPLLDLARIDVADRPAGRAVPVVVSLTPNGRGGPRRDDLASDLTVFHGAGPGLAVPGLVADPESMPPLRLGSHQGSFVCGLVAAINVVASLHARRRAPADARIVSDVSAHEALANSYRQSLGTYAYYGGGTGRDLERGRGAGGTVDHRNLPCKDGYVNIAWGGVQQWDSLKGLLGNPAWTEDPDLDTPALRFKNWRKIVPHLEEWAADLEKEQILYLCQGWRIPSAPVNDGAELLPSDVLRSRGFWREVTTARRQITLPGLPIRRSYPNDGGAEMAR